MIVSDPNPRLVMSLQFQIWIGSKLIRIRNTALNCFCFRSFLGAGYTCPPGHNRPGNPAGRTKGLQPLRIRIRTESAFLELLEFGSEIYRTLVSLPESFTCFVLKCTYCTYSMSNLIPEPVSKPALFRFGMNYNSARTEEAGLSIELVKGVNTLFLFHL